VARKVDPVFENGYQLSFMACAGCGGVVVTAREGALGTVMVPSEWVLLPRGFARPLPPEVWEESPHVAQDFEEASAVLTISPKASAALSRRCLQAVLNEKGKAKSDNLSKQIDAVLPTLPSHLQDSLHAVRVVGNFAAHPQKEVGSGLLLDVEPEEAEWTLEVLEDLFDFYYVQPIRALRQRQNLNEKLERAGKPPLK